jgi:hypothetical protein
MQSRQAGGGDPRSGLDSVASGFGKVLERDRAFQEAFLRLLGAAGGALLAARLAEDVSNLGAVAIGGALGYGLVEISLQAGPCRPARRGRSADLNARQAFLPELAVPST